MEGAFFHKEYIVFISWIVIFAVFYDGLRTHSEVNQLICRICIEKRKLEGDLRQLNSNINKHYINTVELILTKKLLSVFIHKEYVRDVLHLLQKVVHLNWKKLNLFWRHVILSWDMIQLSAEYAIFFWNLQQ